MCPWDTVAQLLQNFAYPKIKNDIIFNERRAITLEVKKEIIWIILKLEQEILMFSIVSKFCKVPFEITRVRNLTWQIMAKFHKQRAITLEGI